MSSYLLDTNHASALYKRQLNLAAHPRRRPEDTFSISMPGIGELWYMVFNSTRVGENVDAMNSMLLELTFIPFDPVAARQFGLIKTELRKAGRMIPDVDIQIAAVARAGD
jgi:tRNA(fMet)-specific endonuclease VapC